MSLIQVKATEGVYGERQKQGAIAKLTDALAETVGERIRSVVVVTFREVQSGAWGIAGKPVTTEGVQALSKG
ncbi:tautomerase family protein [Streptomyces chiangmaiensis]|uniref:Tautomerase family protein n=1 Tax=Streptomyces chiangmaiensis TaxID=766497 RepID=A0ABU7FFQ9_9ACTN|nr:tautomerase family protein [Streptomyces chiangmaiensis]MED7822668.1 tautomerase family protein [Streptomyces chiangmaiensis]